MASPQGLAMEPLCSWLSSHQYGTLLLVYIEKSDNSLRASILDWSFEGSEWWERGAACLLARTSHSEPFKNESKMLACSELSEFLQVLYIL